ncbi:hypothetical protein EYC84_008660 [Monilinia fructicola]|uniref:Uncharacterized protein n=1 Tax=Monilinia fructicola TaxID=38448 RepID=A0A5M9JFX6_MONFR|nr:hypothetical protein EYC84_008660 [Monilinia fructicola]
MASSKKKAVVSRIVVWESSHIDNIVIHDLLKLAEQDLKRQSIISEAIRLGTYSNMNEKDLLAAVVTEQWIDGVIFTKDGERYVIEKAGIYRKAIAITSSNSLKIIEKILGYLVQAPAAAIAPRVVTCNWKKFWAGAPGFAIMKKSMKASYDYTKQASSSHYSSTLIPTPTEDEDGRLIVLRQVHEAELDACILRVCRSFKNIGANLLYRRNLYTFGMNNGTQHGSPPTWIGKGIWRPPPRKPSFKDRKHSATSFYNRINRGITDIRKRVAIKNLAGWVFHDPFLRFLYTIGTENSALIRTLAFSGNVQCHRCERGHFCDDCIFESLRVYIPFINELCPSVHKLTLAVLGDVEDKENVIFDQKAVQFFKDIRQLKYVTELVVIDREPVFMEQIPTTASILAEPTINPVEMLNFHGQAFKAWVAFDDIPEDTEILSEICEGEVIVSCLWEVSDTILEILAQECRNHKEMASSR